MPAAANVEPKHQHKHMPDNVCWACQGRITIIARTQKKSCKCSRCPNCNEPLAKFSTGFFTTKNTPDTAYQAIGYCGFVDLAAPNGQRYKTTWCQA